jgi:hypothetical protein
MIENRPASLLADPAYRTLPKLPLKVDWASSVRHSKDNDDRAAENVLFEV